MKTFLVLIWLLNLKIILTEIRFVFEMFRHGARGPKLQRNSNIDIFGEKWESDGELTSIGMRQHYLIGYRNRIRYSNLISRSYNSKEIYVVSTDRNRTIVSASSQLQGLFSAGTGPLLTPKQASIAVPPLLTDFESEKERLKEFSLPNQIEVIPIHIFDKNSKYIIDLKNECPNSRKYYDENSKSHEISDFYKKFNYTYGSKLKKIYNLSSDENFFNYDYIMNLLDTFVCDYTEGKELNLLTNAGIDLEEFNKTANEFLYLDKFAFEFKDSESILAKIETSPTAFSVVDWMDTRIDLDINGKNLLGYSSPKLVMYSAHEQQMAAVQFFLKSIFNSTNKLYYTPFASSIFFELHRPDVLDYKLTSDDYTVQVIYNDIKLLEIPFPQFKSIIITKSFNMNQIEEICGFSKTPSNNNVLLILTIIFSVIIIALVIYIIKMKMKKLDNVLSNTEYKNIS